MSKEVEIAKMLTSRQRQALEILSNADRPLRNKDFHERFESDGRRTSGWAKALGPCYKSRDHDPASLWARGIVSVDYASRSRRAYEITPFGRAVAAVTKAMAEDHSGRSKPPNVQNPVRSRSSDNFYETSLPKLAATSKSDQLREFRFKLDKLLPYPNSRPFLCHGSPLNSKFFIVGTNSAREIERPFWSFWSDSHGCNRADYLRELEKLARGLTKTRRNIEIVARIAGQKVTLDTNVYLQPTRTESELRPEHLNTDVIDHLLAVIKPKVVLAHGGKARKYFSRRCVDFVDDCGSCQAVTWRAWNWQFKLLCSPHLGFRTLTKEAAAEEAEKIGRVVAEALR